MNYSEIDHSHCWTSENPPCGQKIEHLVCCLCGLPHPSIRSSIESARKQEKEKFLEIIGEDEDEKTMLGESIRDMRKGRNSLRQSIRNKVNQND